MSDYKPTIGLEIHVELKTATKMFCRCQNNPEEKRPNVNICPVCTAQPGALPVINKEAVKHVLRVGAAMGERLPTLPNLIAKIIFIQIYRRVIRLVSINIHLSRAGV
jgi:Asp-tRNA(Asn)/Glu-tRNA(Gln) amidotransferase B subunit